MSIDQTIAPDFESLADELAYRLAGVEAAIQAAIRNDDDQEWLEYLQTWRNSVTKQLAEEQAHGSFESSST